MAESPAPPSLSGVTVSTSGQTLTTTPAESTAVAGDDAAMQASLEQGTEFAAQAAQEVASFVSQLFGSGGQNPDGTYQPTPYNTPLQPMMQQLGQGNPVSGIASPPTEPIAQLINSARTAMGNNRGSAADSFQQQAGQQASNVPLFAGADENILSAVNQSAGAVGNSRQQMMGVIDSLNAAIQALSPILSTATGQAGASSLVTQAIQIGTSILTSLIQILSQISSSELPQAEQQLEQAQGADVEHQAAVDPATGNPAAPTSTSPGKPAFPADGPLTSTWGDDRDHQGIDIGAPMGSDIRAAAGGQVISSGPADGFGRWIRVQHDDGTITVYGHNSANYVNVGDRVSAGQVIGAVGSEGQSTGPHLHFEVHPAGGAAVDPMPWLAANGAMP